MPRGFFSPSRLTSSEQARLRRAIQALVSSGQDQDFTIELQDGKKVKIVSSGEEFQYLFQVETLATHKITDASDGIFYVLINGDIVGVGGAAPNLGGAWSISSHNDGYSNLAMPGVVKSELPTAYSIQEINAYGLLTEGAVHFKNIDGAYTPDTPTSGYGSLIVHTDYFDGVKQQCLKVLFSDGSEQILGSVGGRATSILNRVEVSSNSAISIRGRVYSATAGGLTLTLASALAGSDPETWVAIHDKGGNAGSSAITIATEGSETINGAASIQLTANYEAVWLYNDGSNWFGWRMSGA